MHRVGGNEFLSPALPLLTERLRDADWAAGGFTTNNQWLSPRFGFSRGFAEYDIYDMDELLYPLAMDWLSRSVPRAESASER